MTDIDLDKSADWCVQAGGISIAGTDMVESSRESDGIKWCFHCRKRHEFWWVVMVPNGLSYYGPSAHMEGVGRYCTDLFPGWVRMAPDI
ncbi:hypothetical protein [Microbacterium enclense]|uniref:hypothetical protein n=1 Tax=Microbacterium enclense TaxID=993073 RepID=UPI00341F692A